jgi:hypothetical protein
LVVSAPRDNYPNGNIYTATFDTNTNLWSGLTVVPTTSYGNQIGYYIISISKYIIATIETFTNNVYASVFNEDTKTWGTLIYIQGTIYQTNQSKCTYLQVSGYDIYKSYWGGIYEDGTIDRSVYRIAKATYDPVTKSWSRFVNLDTYKSQMNYNSIVGTYESPFGSVFAISDNLLFICNNVYSTISNFVNGIYYRYNKYNVYTMNLSPVPFYIKNTCSISENVVVSTQNINTYVYNYKNSSWGNPVSLPLQ